MGADVARGRGSQLQSLQRGPISGQDAFARGVVPLHHLRRVLPLQLPRQWKSLLSESPTPGVQDLPFGAGGHHLTSCGSHALKSRLHLALCLGVRGDRAFFRSPNLQEPAGWSKRPSSKAAARSATRRIMSVTSADGREPVSAQCLRRRHVLFPYVEPLAPRERRRRTFSTAC